ncbi:MAG: DUF58 domain-containing protein [Candidatus Woesearchaeota archaeon]|jgi:uncharacterized protein (DUF58 family)|nr:DUF58 domain-containing protein [Candidatus Woesearchaeota archaeon]
MAKLRVDLKPAIKRLEIITSGVVSAWAVGQYKSVFRGKGAEFDGYRDYSLSDDSSLIDWKASVRGHKLIVKEFIEERNLNIFFLVDVSASMVFGSTHKLKNEYAAEIVGSLTHIILEAGDKIGMALFSDKIVKKFPPNNGRNQFYIVSKNLVDSGSYGGKYDLVEAIKFLIGFLKERAIVMIVSDFIGLKGDWQKYLKIAGHKYDLIGVMVRDPRDRVLPADNTNVFVTDPYSNKQIVFNPVLLKDGYEKHVKMEEERIKKVFLNSNCDFINLSTDTPFESAFVNFFTRRRRKAK